MIQSMTGFGRSEVHYADKKITVQLKSLNSKKLDVYSRIPSEYKAKELHFHKILSNALTRGKVDFSLAIEGSSGETETKINQSVVRKYIEELKVISGSEMAAEIDLLKIAITLPNVMKTQREEVDEKELEAIEKGLEKALQKLNTYRSDEGQALEKDFKLRVENISDLLKNIEGIDLNRTEEKRKKLRAAVTELKEEIDENRFEQELIYYLEKYDITEEIIRLRNHLTYFTETMNSEEANGQKLRFITQEMGREINTIGSKSNYAPMQKYVVRMKDELEKIKEQLLNVL